MSIYNFEIFHATSDPITDIQRRQILESGAEVEASLEAVVDSLLTLTQKELAQYLPKSGYVVHVSTH